MTKSLMPPMPFDGDRAESLADMMALDFAAFDDLGCAAAGAWTPPSDAFLSLRVSTANTLRLDLAEALVVGITRRMPRLEHRAMDMRCALQEAIGNAVVHGNLGMDSTLRNTLAGLREFSRVQEARRKDPARACLPVTVWAVALADGIEVAVEDAGDGFSPDSIRLPASGVLTAGGGMGLSIIRQCVNDLRFELEGRRIVMVFSYS